MSDKLDDLVGHYSDPRSSADIDNRFGYHPATGDRGAKHESIREACKELGHFLDRVLPPGRDKARALTHLDDVCMCSNAAIARHIE